MAEHRRAATMIRKQFYLAPEHQRKLSTLARRWRCTEAEVVRRALERLPEAAPESEFLERLYEAGVLIESEENQTLPPENVAALEEQLHERLRRRLTPLDLTSAVIEDRR